MDKKMDIELNNMVMTPNAVAAGLMAEVNGQAYITDAGLFALAGVFAHSPEIDSHEHCMKGLLRAMVVARASGLDAKEEAVIIWAFAEGFIPGDGSQEGAALASLCGRVAGLVGRGRMSSIIEGRKAH